MLIVAPALTSIYSSDPSDGVYLLIFANTSAGIYADVCTKSARRFVHRVLRAQPSVFRTNLHHLKFPTDWFTFPIGFYSTYKWNGKVRRETILPNFISIRVNLSGREINFDSSITRIYYPLFFRYFSLSSVYRFFLIEEHIFGLILFYREFRRTLFTVVFEICFSIQRGYHWQRRISMWNFRLFF